jgi:tetratricopeptide (TPR) repeat protein
VLVLGASAARAADPLLEERNPLISRAIEEFEDGNYDEVAQLLNRALTESQPTNEQKLQIYLYLGRSQARRGNESEARKAFGRLLVLDPEAALPADADEDEKYAFERAQAKRAEEDAKVDASEVNIQHRPPGAVVAGQAATIAVEGVALPEGTTVTLYHTRSMDSPYSSSLMDNPERGKWTAPIPTVTISDTTEEYEIYYYIEVTDASDEVLASAGEEEAPLKFRVLAPKVEEESGPVYKEWWFWTAIGGGAAVVLALGLGLGLGLDQGVTTGSADVTITISE